MRRKADDNILKLMKKFVVYANCQGVGLARTLLENPEFASRYEWLNIDAVQTLGAQHIPDVLEKVAQADLFIHQPVKGESGGRAKELGTDFLLTRLKPGAVSHSFPSLYFNGYFPHLYTLNKMVSSVLNHVHDYVIAYSWSLDLPQEKVLEIMNHEDLYPEQVATQLANASLGNLRTREDEDGLDVYVSDFLADNFRKAKLFHQFNHPTRPVFVYVAERILSLLGISDEVLDQDGPDYLRAIAVPVYRSTHKALSLSFEEDFSLYSTAGGQQLEQAEVVNRFYSYYEGQDKELLRTIIERDRPFVPLVVKARL